MILLPILWMTSLLLSAAAGLIMVGLIVSRRLAEGREAIRGARRRDHLGLLLDDPRMGSGHPSAQEEVDLDLVADLLLEILQLVRGDERKRVVESATRLGLGRTLRRRLAGGTPDQRLAATEALAHFTDDETFAALEAAFDDPSQEVRLSAALSLASAGRGPAADKLVEWLGIGTEEHSLLVVTLFREIARHRPGEVKALVLDPSTIPTVKVAAIDALTATGDYSLVTVIADLALAAEDGSEELPRYMHALADFGHPAGATAVLKGLESSDPVVRALSAKAARRIGMADAAKRLGALLADPDWWVRFRAGEALLHLGPKGERLLKQAARTGSGAARETAALTLAERKSAA